MQVRNSRDRPGGSAGPRARISEAMQSTAAKRFLRYRLEQEFNSRRRKTAFPRGDSNSVLFAHHAVARLIPHAQSGRRRSSCRSEGRLSTRFTTTLPPRARSARMGGDHGSDRMDCMSWSGQEIWRPTEPTATAKGTMVYAPGRQRKLALANQKGRFPGTSRNGCLSNHFCTFGC